MLRIKLCAAAAAIMLLVVIPAEASVELVMVVHRHGARTLLVKNATSLAEGGAALTAQGAGQLREIGKTFRGRYLDPSTCGDDCLEDLPKGAYDGTRVRVISSGFDRTLASAASFQQGAFPSTPALPIPVYSTPPPDDWIIRAYENCPAYLVKMNDWFKSEEFLAYQAKVAPLMAKLSTITSKNVTLINFWNTFDELNTQRDAVLLSSRLTLNEALSEPVWPQVVETADWLEAGRYGRAVAGNLIGGTLLSEILYRMRSRISNAQPAAQRLVEYSAHYPTIMALLATLPFQKNDTVFLSGIPSYGAMLAFELRKAGASGPYVVSLRAQDGAEATYRTVPLPCAKGGDAAENEGGVGSCTYEDFQALAAPEAITAQGQWCTICNATKMDACAGIKAQPALDNPATYDFTLNKTSAADAGGFVDLAKDAPQSAVTMGGGGGGDDAGKIAGAAVGSALGAALLTAAVMGAWFSCRQPGWWRNSGSGGGSGNIQMAAA
eukprot:CAMPEP_0206141512 /NCGR_PEP_ID=MMETSP1473-20131121/13185_1 /ASSEMBLY_ACC=CAM_ASM_001109 /TAXON_ID=1461547 /ORGANISM="Stichococcus sp, Strain RCC1054" /LENGTH=493 /DNA_ID=CAMNT_0053536111 /DNA_START=15 /DNA_END=1496 /DNA_ORIENTATION=+